jgi:hypothetical protein
MIVSYDMDGVLALNPPPNTKKWGHMNGVERRARKEFLYDWYNSAEPLYKPTEDKFHVISARKKDQRTWEITMNWLNKYFPGRVISLSLLNVPRTVNNVVKFKNDAINSIGAVEHTEDNKKVLRGISKINKNIKLYFWEKDMVNKEVFNG